MFISHKFDEIFRVSDRWVCLRDGEKVGEGLTRDVTEPELVRLIQDLLACELPYCCPHGRPTMIQLSYAELEKKFGRKV